MFNQTTTQQETHQKEKTQTRMKVIHSNPPQTTASTRVKTPRSLPTPAPTSIHNSKPTLIVAYEDDEYTPQRL